MRKSTKKILAVSTAAVLACGIASSLAACGPNIVGVDGVPQGEPTSNGGFVVGVGDYYYFINGVETSTSDNTYGTPVKGALQRIKKDDVKAGNGDKAETVIPSLMVAGDTDAGLFVYDGRVYYATPTNVRNTLGEVENSWLDFKSASLDGTDIKDLFRVESNTTKYRFVKEGEHVYVLYIASNEKQSSTYDIHSFNTDTSEDTVLVQQATNYLFHASDKTNPYVYYTMSVTERADSDNPKSRPYNQIYRVRADATEAAYEYGEWDQDWLDENNDGEVPYLNLGEIVLDGIGIRHVNENKDAGGSQFSHSTSTPFAPVGYTYTLKSYNNDGLYFTSNQVASTDESTLFYLAADKLDSSWDSIAANDPEGTAFDKIASGAASSKTDSAFFYIEDDLHHYIYASGSNIVRADVIPEEGGKITTETTTIARSASSPRFIMLDNTSHHVENPTDGNPDLHYLYYANAVSGGYSVNRAVYNGVTNETRDDYNNDLPHVDDKTEYYVATRVLEVQHMTGWYDYEVLDGILFFADATSYTYDDTTTTFNYISTVNLNNENGLMNNIELGEFNEKYDDIINIISGDEDSLIQKITSEVSSRLATAIEYFFYTGDTELTVFKQKIEDAAAVNDGDKEFLYDEEEQLALEAFANGGGFTYHEGKDDSKELFKADDFKGYRTYSGFVTKIGTWTEEDTEGFQRYWYTRLENFTEPTEEEEALPGWAIAVIVVGCVLVVGVAAGLAVFFVLKKKKAKEEAPKPKRMHVDTTDDKDIDVYAVEPEPVPVEEIEEAPAEEIPAEEAEEAPVEEAPEATETEETPTEE